MFMKTTLQTKVMLEAGRNVNMKLYLLVLGATLTFDEVKNFIDGQQCVRDWFYSMPNSMFLVSDLSAPEIYDRIRSKFKEGRVFITEVSPNNRQGWMPRSHWAKINKVNA